MRSREVLNHFFGAFEKGGPSDLDACPVKVSTSKSKLYDTLLVETRLGEYCCGFMNLVKVSS